MHMNTNSSWFPLILVAFASFIITLDSTFMNVSISQLVVDLNTQVSVVQMIICFYTLTTASLMLVSSKLQDIIGKRTIFLIGAGIYGLGALIAALSQNALMLFIGWSLLEGIGGAFMTPAVVSIISGTYSGEKRTFALAISSAIVGIAAAIGPLFGGVVTTFLSWRYGFVFELLIIVFIFVFHNQIKTFPTTASKSDFDVVGGILAISGLVTFVYGILTLQHNQMNSAILMVVGCLILICFALFETRCKKQDKIPLLDMSLLKDRNLKAGMLIRLITNLSIGGSLFAVSIFLQSVLKLGAFSTGLTLLPLTVVMMVFSILAPRLVTKLNVKSVMSIGFIITIIGVILLRNQFELTTGFMDLVPGLIVYGAGLGLVISLGVGIALKNIDKEKENTASGLITTGQTLGTSMGTAIIGCLLIMGAVGGMHDAIDTYAPDQITDAEFHDNVHVYFEKLGHVNTTQLKHENTLKEKIVNTVVQDAMKLVMEVTAVILFIGLLLTLTLKDEKINRKNKKSMSR